jgi:type I restriction enzyme S subunit
MSYNGTFSKSKLAPLCRKIGSGATPRGGKDTYLESGPFSLIRSQNVYNNRFTNDGLAFISAEQADDLSNVEVEAGDVLLNITGDSVARCCQAAVRVLPARVNQHVAIIRPDSDQLDARFLRYFLVSPQMQEQMLMLAGAGATRQALTKGMIENFDVPKPDIKEQRAIAKVLGELDDKIELNQQTNETLEALARSLFKAHFVDVVASKLPKGWRTGKLRDCCERVENGGTPKRDEPSYWSPATIPWLTSGEVRQAIVTKTDNFISEEGLENSSAKLWPAATTVVALYGATAGQVCFLSDRMCSNQACCGLIPKNDLRYYVYLHASSSVAAFEQQTRGSAQQNLSQQIVADFPTVIPDADTLTQFDQIVHPIFARWIDNLNESRTLAELRDALLPKLLSGELRVPENRKDNS